MRSILAISVGALITLGLAGCNLPPPAQTVTPVAVVESSVPLPYPTETATEAPTPTPTMSAPGDWQTYTDKDYSFSISYPPEGQVISQQDHTVRILLPIIEVTNLVEKFIDVTVVENADPCVSQNPGAGQLQSVNVNGMSFLEERGADAGAGQVYEWMAYSTVKNNVCVSLSFVLHSSNPGNYSTPPSLFDMAAESDIFALILDSFAWLNP